MLIPIGFFGGGASGSYELIQTTLVSSMSTTVTLSSIPNTYKHLQIRATLRGGPATNDRPWIQFNGLAGQNYAEHSMYGNGSAVYSSGAGNQDKISQILIPGDNGTALVFGAFIIDVLDYGNTSGKYKIIRSLGGSARWNTSNEVGLVSGLVKTTSAINSVTIGSVNGGIAAGSRISIYGIKGA